MTHLSLGQGHSLTENFTETQSEFYQSATDYAVCPCYPVLCVKWTTPQIRRGSKIGNSGWSLWDSISIKIVPLVLSCPLLSSLVLINDHLWPTYHLYKDTHWQKISQENNLSFRRGSKMGNRGWSLWDSMTVTIQNHPPRRGGWFWIVTTQTVFLWNFLSMSVLVQVIVGS